MSRIARLAARLDALCRGDPPAADDLQITRRGDELVIRLPPGVVATLDFSAGDPVAGQLSGQRSLNIEVHRHVPGQPPPPQK